MNTIDLPPLALIAGPTASGKSALALAAADLAPVTIINADSVQVYRDLRILSARPDESDMARAPHQLFGYVDGAESCSAARWAADAKRAIANARAERRLPLLVGGTGLYIRTLLDGIAPIPEIDPDIRASVRAMSVEQAYAALCAEHPDSAERLDPGDTTRVHRALEVLRSSGLPIGYWHDRREGGIGDSVELRPLVLLPPRDWLVSRCDFRFLGMAEGGGAAEVERLLERRLDPDLPVMRAIGVQEIAAWLRKETNWPQMLHGGRVATRQYAKRQYTWFRNQLPEDWERIDRPLDADLIEELALELVAPQQL